MGMSASQVRFLSLQHRKHDVGRQLTTLSNRKLSLSRDMNRIAKNYTNAMNQNVLRWSNDSGITYHDLTYDTMMSPNELNAAKPYIVTDAASGRVVLNNDELIGLDGKPLTDDNGNKVTYVDIANMISTYSGMNKDTNKAEYGNSNAIHVGTDGVTMGDKAIDGAYYVPDLTREFTFDNSLRYEIFRRMGLISEQQVQTQKSLLTKLYGGIEAQQAGVYPIGSAWGNYYIALANLDAYEDFLNHEQSLATADTFRNVNGSADSYNLGVKFKDSSDLYTYEANVNVGDSGQGTSTITQTIRPEGNQAVKHVDFKHVVVNGGDGWESVASNGSDAEQYMYNETDLIDDYQYFKSELNASRDGIVYTYKVNNVLDNALRNYQGSTIISTNGTEVDVMAKVRSTGKDAVIRLEDYGRSHLETSEKEDAIRDLEAIVGVFEAVMQASDLAEYPADVLRMAAVKTVELYKQDDSFIGDRADCGHTEGYVYGKADEYAQGKIGIGYCEKRAKWYPWWDSGARLATTVDARVLYDVFMTYANYYLLDENKDASLLTVGSQANLVEDPVHDASIPEPDPTATQSYESGCFESASNIYSITGHSNTSNGAECYSRSILSTEGVALDDSTSLFVKYSDGSIVTTGSLQTYSTATKPNPAYTPENGEPATINITCTDDGTREHYLGLQRNASGGLKSYYYILDGSTITSTLTDSTGYLKMKNTKEETGWACTVYQQNSGSTKYTQLSNGSSLAAVVTVEEGDSSITYLLNATGWNRYKNAVITGRKEVSFENICGAGNYEAINATGGTDSAELTAAFNQILYSEEESRAYDRYSGSYIVKLTDQNATNARFDIRSYATPKDDEAFHNKLRDAVQDALDYIDELETELTDFYGAAESKVMDFYDALFMKIAQSGWMIDDRTSRSRTTANDYLDGRLQNNDYFVTVVEQSADSLDYDYLTRQAVNVTKIFQVHDEDAENIALSEYEAEKTLISSKERVIDARMRKLETEQEVINTELDSIKQIIKDNVDKTFKIFA